MRVGEDVAVGADDEAGAEIQLAIIFLLRHFGHIGHQPLEKFVKRIVVGKLAQIHAAIVACRSGGRIFGGLDIHHAGAFLLHQLGEIGQQHAHAAAIGFGFDRLHKFAAFFFGIAEKAA